MSLAEQLGSHYLEVRIRIWLAPLLPSVTARACLDVAYSVAEKDGLHSLLEEIAVLDRNLPGA